MLGGSVRSPGELKMDKIMSETEIVKVALHCRIDLNVASRERSEELQQAEHEVKLLQEDIVKSEAHHKELSQQLAAWKASDEEKAETLRKKDEQMQAMRKREEESQAAVRKMEKELETAKRQIEKDEATIKVKNQLLEEIAAALKKEPDRDWLVAAAWRGELASLEWTKDELEKVKEEGRKKDAALQKKVKELQLTKEKYDAKLEQDGYMADHLEEVAGLLRVPNC